MAAMLTTLILEMREHDNELERAKANGQVTTESVKPSTRTAFEDSGKMVNTHGFSPGDVLRSKRWKEDRTIRFIEKHGIYFDSMGKWFRSIPADARRIGSRELPDMCEWVEVGETSRRLNITVGTILSSKFWVRPKRVMTLSSSAVTYGREKTPVLHYPSDVKVVGFKPTREQKKLMQAAEEVQGDS